MEGEYSCCQRHRARAELARVARRVHLDAVLWVLDEMDSMPTPYLLGKHSTTNIQRLTSDIRESLNDVCLPHEPPILNRRKRREQWAGEERGAPAGRGSAWRSDRVGPGFNVQIFWGNLSPSGTIQSQ